MSYDCPPLQLAKTSCQLVSNPKRQTRTSWQPWVGN